MLDLKLPQKRTFLGPASVWKRALSFIFDIMLLDFFILNPLSALAGDIIGTTDVFSAYTLLQNNAAQMQAVTLLFSIMIVLILAYFVLLEYAIGQTLGSMLMNMRVAATRDHENYTAPNFMQCLTRNMFIIPAVPFIFLWIIDPVYMIFAKKGQRFSEWLSQTQVVEQYEL